MGQRTQVLIIKHSRDGQKKVEFYHHQWGYGRNMFLAVMFLYMRYYGSSAWNYEPREGSWDERKVTMERNFIFDVGKLEGMDSFYHENEQKEWTKVQQEILDKADINDFKSVMDACGMGDNNNGWCVIDITPGKDEWDNPHFKVGWILGEEGYSRDRWGNYKPNKYYEEWVTAEEYGKLNVGNNFSDRKFVKMYLSFCNYFDIEDIAKLEREKAAKEVKTA